MSEWSSRREDGICVYLRLCIIPVPNDSCGQTGTHLLHFHFPLYRSSSPLHCMTSTLLLSQFFSGSRMRDVEISICPVHLS